MSESRYLVRWGPTMSDGSSLYRYRLLGWTVGRALERRGIDRYHPVFTGRDGHDHRYYLGGSEADRLKADRELYGALRDLGVPRWLAQLVYRGVRVGGAPWLKVEGVSWGFGGSCFRYTEEPARECYWAPPRPDGDIWVRGQGRGWDFGTEPPTIVYWNEEED